MDRSPAERIVDTYQPLLPWQLGQLFGRRYGRLVALSMCRPTSKMVQDAIGAIGELPTDLVKAFQWVAYNRDTGRQKKLKCYLGSRLRPADVGAI